MISVALLDQICKSYVIGTPTRIKKLASGLHTTWYFKTMKGEFSLKLINSRNSQLLNHNLLSPQHSQQVAYFMAQNKIMTAPALEIKEDFFLVAKNKTFLVFPWIDGQVLPSEKISVGMAKIIGETLQEIHSVNFSRYPFEHTFLLPVWEGFPEHHWRSFITIFAQAHPQVADLINIHLHSLTKWSENAKKSLLELNKNTLLSHRDFDPKNVVWFNNKTPVILDWEYAGLINPDLDLFIVAMNWSDVLTGKINNAKFHAVLEGFGKEVRFSDKILYGYLGYCLDWLEFNLRKLDQGLYETEEIIDQVATTITALYAVEQFFESGVAN